MTRSEIKRRKAGVDAAIERATDTEELENLRALRDEMDALDEPAYPELLEESRWQQEVMEAVTEYGAYYESV